MKTRLILLTMFLLSACNGGSELQNAVLENLNDPDSAKFKEEIVSEDGKKACIVWNSKNTMGGYGDWKVAELRFEDAKWVAEKMEGHEYNCSEIAFKAIDAMNAAHDPARLEAIAILQKARNVSPRRAKEISETQCSRVVSSFVSYSGYLAEYKVRQDQQSIDSANDLISQKRAVLESGDCTKDF
ncbi:MAG TPA: hypothetical protein PK873_14130 [Pseudomonas sp.]|uniref:hypothetical protein n=1 Tax=Pseudomonas sp. TaxID=306 RepID=UPI002B79254C|nr:hypothetical protein [Pseudomonas sp.]HRL94687.1 hypothetical protein [Pseudomonas sp.]